MNTEIVTTLITSIFSLLTALGSVWLKARLERRTVPDTREEARGEVDEAAPEPEQPAAPEVKSRWGWKRPLLVFVGAFAFGLITRALRPLFTGTTHWETLTGLIVLVLVSLGLAVDHRRERRGFWPYELEVMALWLAYSSGWSVGQGAVWSDLVVVTVGWWLGCAVVGGLIVVVASKKAF